MSASEGEMNLSEEERGNEELEHRFKQLSTLENASSDGESANPHLPDGQEMTDELRGVVEHATDIIVSIKDAIKECSTSEIKDEQTRLIRFEEALKKYGFKIDTIFQTITAAYLALEESGLCNIKPLQQELLAVKYDIEQFQENAHKQKEHDSGFLVSIPLLSRLTDSTPSRKAITIPFTKIDDASYSDSYHGEHTSEEKGSTQTNTSFARNSFLATQDFEAQPEEEEENAIKMNPFPKSLSEKIALFENSPLEDQNVQDALIQIKSIADFFDDISGRNRSSVMDTRLSEKDWRGYITLLEDNISLIQEFKEDSLREIRDDAIDLKWNLLKLYAEQVFEVSMAQADVDLPEILEHIIAIKNGIDKVQKQEHSNEQLDALKVILKVQKTLIQILSIDKQSSKSLGEKEASANDMVGSEADWRKHITELKRAITCINGCENISVDIKTPAINLPLKLLALYAKQVFQIDMTEDDVDLQNILEHVIAIKNAINEAQKQDSPSGQLAALEEVLREEGILKKPEIDIETIHEIIESFIKKLNKHYSTLKKELNTLKNEMQEYKKKGTEEDAASPSGSSDRVPPSDYRPPAQSNSLFTPEQFDAPYSASFNGESSSFKKRTEKEAAPRGSSNDESLFEEVKLDGSPYRRSLNGELSSHDLSLAPTSGPSIQVQAKTDVPPGFSKGEMDDPDSDSSDDEDDSAKKTPNKMNTSSSLNLSFVTQVVGFLGEQLEILSTRITTFKEDNETAYKVIRAIAITTLVLGVVIGVTAATWGIGPAALALGGAIAAHAAIAETVAESVFALGALVAAGFFGRKCGKKERAEEEKLCEGRGQGLPTSPGSTKRI